MCYALLIVLIGRILYTCTKSMRLASFCRVKGYLHDAYVKSNVYLRIQFVVIWPTYIMHCSIIAYYSESMTLKSFYYFILSLILTVIIYVSYWGRKGPYIYYTYIPFSNINNIDKRDGIQYLLKYIHGYVYNIHTNMYFGESHIHTMCAAIL